MRLGAQVRFVVVAAAAAILYSWRSRIACYRSIVVPSSVLSFVLVVLRHDSSLMKHHADSIQMISKSSNNSVKCSVLLP
ncbi:hypothetical protein K1719_020730 [Acacia pycnantha]|nr:hypothetical protein K1719_020730 [Acacia pycnantha]